MGKGGMTGMTSIERIEEIRYAAKKLLETIEMVDPDQPLNTSQIISLYFWLIDHESIKQVKPVRSLIEILMPCLENQIIDRQRFWQLQKTCQKIIGSRDSDSQKSKGVSEGRVMFF